MLIPPPCQSTFAGGEIAPTLHSRHDLKKHGSSLKRCHNAIVTKHGAWINRSGTLMGEEVKDSSLKARILPFIFSGDVALVLEFGQYYMRVHQNGVRLAVEVVTPYTAALLPYLKLAQSGDVVTITCPGQDPKELKRTNADNLHWTLDSVIWMPQIPAPTNLALQPGVGWAINATHPYSQEWDWVVTAIGTQGEGVPTPKVTLTTVLATDAMITVRWDAVPGATGYNVYRGRDGIFGLIGTTGTSTPGYSTGHLAFHDDGADPDFSVNPRRGTVPYAAPLYPTAVAYHQQRRWFVVGQDLYGSAVGDYANYDLAKVVGRDDAAVKTTVASTKYEIARTLRSMGSMLALTGSSEWTIGGPADVGITNSTVTAKWQGGRGSAYLDPVTVGNELVFLQALGSEVRTLVYEPSSDSYQGIELSVMASHLLESAQIVDWDFAQVPYSVIWAVRSDGVLLGLTYNKEQEMAAWHWHDTNGKFESVCVIPENGEDTTYVVVARQIGGATRRYVERFATRAKIPRLPGGKIDAAKGVFLDSSRVYAGAGLTILNNLAHLEGCSVMALVDSFVAGPYVVTGGQIDISEEFPDGAAYAIVGLSYVSEGHQLSLGPQFRANQKTVFKAAFDVVDTVGLKFGVDPNRLRSWKQRAVRDNYAPTPAFTGRDTVSFPNSYGDDALLIFRQEDPLPVTIAAVTREVDVGGN